MCIRVASIAILLVALFLPSQGEQIHTIAKKVPRPFLDKVSKDATAEFWNVVKDKKLTVKQVRQKQLEWAKKHGVKDQLEKFYKDFEAKAKRTEKKMDEILKSLPGLFKKYMAIADDSKTLNQILKERKALVDKNKKELKMILGALLRFRL
ncbi:hypothetical protein Aduo_008596 [Ancylostoma duodenale]